MSSGKFRPFCPNILTHCGLLMLYGDRTSVTWKLAQVMFCHLFITKPLPKPMLLSWQLLVNWKTSAKFYKNTALFKQMHLEILSVKTGSSFSSDHKGMLINKPWDKMSKTLELPSMIFQIDFLTHLFWSCINNVSIMVQVILLGNKLNIFCAKHTLKNMIDYLVFTIWHADLQYLAQYSSRGSKQLISPTDPPSGFLTCWGWVTHIWVIRLGHHWFR